MICSISRPVKDEVGAVDQRKGFFAGAGLFHFKAGIE
jgi:hypothetical protein